MKNTLKLITILFSVACWETPLIEDPNKPFELYINSNLDIAAADPAAGGSQPTPCRMGMSMRRYNWDPLTNEAKWDWWYYYTPKKVGRVECRSREYDDRHNRWKPWRTDDDTCASLRVDTSVYEDPYYPHTGGTEIMFPCLHVSGVHVEHWVIGTGARRVQRVKKRPFPRHEVHLTLYPDTRP